MSAAGGASVCRRYSPHHAPSLRPRSGRVPSSTSLLRQQSGLVINFSKSTLVLMHIDPEVLSTVVESFKCRVGAFPLSYLGFPLSRGKLKLNHFTTMIAKVDRYLAGWRARLLSPAGRLVLINAVLDSLPTYAMAAMRLPPVVLAKLDGMRRAFL
ncbi:retrotransposon protein [Hordeum vulgare]|nr:retrotransposon protein [Hordeum vulgare]